MRPSMTSPKCSPESSIRPPFCKAGSRIIMPSACSPKTSSGALRQPQCRWLGCRSCRRSAPWGNYWQRAPTTVSTSSRLRSRTSSVIQMLPKTSFGSRLPGKWMSAGTQNLSRTWRSRPYSETTARMMIPKMMRLCASESPLLTMIVDKRVRVSAPSSVRV